LRECDLCSGNLRGVVVNGNNFIIKNEHHKKINSYIG
jgi:hypothetical protein